MTNHADEKPGRTTARSAAAALSEPQGPDPERVTHVPHDHADSPATEARLVQPGWLVRSWAGDRIGSVSEVGSDSLLVRLNSIDAREVRVPLALVSGVDEAENLATLSVEASELDGVELQTGQLDLSGGSA